MVLALPRRSLLPALCLCASSALAGPVEDCRNPNIADAERLPICTVAIKVAEDPVDSADLLLWRGAIHNRMKDYMKADADFQEAQDLRPDWADPLVERAFSFFDRGRPDEAVAEMTKAWGIEPGSLHVGQSLLWLHGETGRWQNCLDVAAQVLALAPEDPEALANRGRCRAELGDHAAAEADARRALELELDGAWIHSNLAWSLLELGRPEEAVLEARKALELDPDDQPAHRHLIRALALTDGPEAAMAALAEVPGGATQRMEHANDAAWDLFRDGHAAAEALPYAEAAMALMRESGTSDGPALDTYAHLLAATGKAEEATKAFLEAAATDPARPVRYAERLTELGVPADPTDPTALEAALLACAAMGAACRLSD